MHLFCSSGCYCWSRLHDWLGIDFTVHRGGRANIIDRVAISAMGGGDLGHSCINYRGSFDAIHALMTPPGLGRCYEEGYLAPLWPSHVWCQALSGRPFRLRCLSPPPLEV